MADTATEAPGRVRRWLDRITSPGGLILSAVVIAVLVPLTGAIDDPDFWWHVKAGQLLLQTHHLIATDPFTYTVPQNHWTMHEWLWEVILALIHDNLGLWAVILLISVSTWLGLMAVVAKARADRPGVGMLALGLVAAVLVGAPIWGPRVQMLTFALICLVLWMAERHLRGNRGRLTWLLVPLFLFWGNLHGGFIGGLAFLVLILVAEVIGHAVGWPGGAPWRRIRSLAVITVLSTLVCLINPNGPSILLYALQTQTSGAQQSFIVEWFSPDFHIFDIEYLYAPFLFSLILLIVVNRKIRIRDAALVAATIALSLQSVRHIVLLVAAATPVWVNQMQMAWDKLRAALASRPRGSFLTRPRPLPPLWLRTAVTIPILLLVFGFAAVRYASVASIQENSFYYATTYPVCAARYLESAPEPLKVFNQYGDGGYLAYTLSGHGDKIFIFGDAALMGDSMLYTYSDIEKMQPNWDQILYSSGTDVVVFVTNKPVVNVLRKSPHWIQVYSDPRDVVFVRADKAAQLEMPPQPSLPSNPTDPCRRLFTTPPSQWPGNQ